MHGARERARKPSARRDGARPGVAHAGARDRADPRRRAPAAGVPRAAAEDPVVAQRVVGALGVAPGRADPRPRGLVGQPGRLRRRLPAHGSHAGAARVADARVGRTGCCSPTAGSTTSSVAGCSVTPRTRRPTRTGACTWRTTVRNSGPTSRTSRCTPAIRSPGRASAASWCATRPGRPGSSSSAPRPPASARPTPVSGTRCGRSSRCRRSCSAPRSSAGYWWLYPVFWLLPFLTVWRVINRLRSIAEHGGMDASPDRRATTHTVRQSWWSRTVLVPFNIGWHLAHHVDAGISMRHLPALPPSAPRCRVRHAGARIPRLPGAVAGTAHGYPRFRSSEYVR